jgi:hypothetical protein
VPGGHADIGAGKHARNGEARIVLRRERDEPREPAGRVEQPIHCIAVGGAHGIARVGAAVAVGRADERALDVDPAHDVRHERIALPQRDNPAEAALHERDVVGRDRQ